jgi:hypothetical protein
MLKFYLWSHRLCPRRCHRCILQGSLNQIVVVAVVIAGTDALFITVVCVIAALDVIVVFCVLL